MASGSSTTCGQVWGRVDETLCCSDDQRAKAGLVARSFGRMATAAVAVALLQTATGGVEVPGVSQHIRAGPQLWTPPGTRANWTATCANRNRRTDRNHGRGVCDSQRQTSKAGWSDLGLSPGATGLSEEEHCPGGVQLTAAQQKMEEAKIEMTAADKSVNEAKQLAVQGTTIFADAEVLVQTSRFSHQQ